MRSDTTPPIPPRPDLAPAEAAGEWAVYPADRRGVARRALEIWRRTLPAAVGLTVVLQGIPALVQRLLTPRATGTTALSVWLRTGHLPSFVPNPPPAPHPVVLPLSLLATVVLMPLLYASLLRLMMGASVGEQIDARRALSYGAKRLGGTIVVGLCVILIMTAIAIPLAIALVAFVTAHQWKLGVVVLAVGFAIAYSVFSMSVAALVGEGLTGFRATGRSWLLAWRSLGLVVGVLGGMQLVVGGMGLLGSFVVSRTMAGGAELLVEGLVTLVITAFTVPLEGAVITSAYLELRARSEDLEPAMFGYALQVGDQR
jgi:hypothetical protein